ncbi:protein cycle-like isoform X1 [Pomacea canaliculata]|uniref:protein cycle-like isoform X1 n=1 Tax=Pomacea canaliculata TaxID=400727 RepID=UPI000D72CB00|nr:protein cycle-like isoform X1 [Pomacea canaliculata]XP_025086092.1 protein cycle-like isoform X1 [Pomacea canaliculata]XP_025086093.1 protein cycle-like isoform X1 [Pomacea canaliculata]
MENSYYQSAAFHPYAQACYVPGVWYSGYPCPSVTRQFEADFHPAQLTACQSTPCSQYHPQLTEFSYTYKSTGVQFPLPGVVKPVVTGHPLAYTNPSTMDRKRKRSSTSIDGFESCEDDDDLQASTPQDPNDPECRRHQRQNHSEIEKRRRDKMNSYITELSAMIPMCSAMNRKLDKLTVLRMAVQHMKSVRGSSKMYSEVSHKPSFISDDELKHLILNVAEGFLFVVGCDRGRILYVSESVKDTLQYSQSDLIGQSLFDILHPRDISKVKEQLSSSDLTPRERLIDAKTMMPVKTELPQKQTQLCSGARRSFFCRMKCSSKVPPDMNAQPVKVKKEPVETHYHRKRRSESKNFMVIHCTGYLKSWSTAKIGLEDDSETDSDSCSLSCLVAVGRVQNGVNPFPAEESGHIKVRPMEYMSRHSIDGKFSYIDERATVILGYLPQELLGTSVYEYYHQDDIPAMGNVHRKVLSSKEKVETEVYRFKVKDGKFLHLKSKCFGFRNPWTKEVEYIVSTNSVVQVQEVTSSGQLEASVTIADEEDYAPIDIMGESSQGSKSVFIPGLLGGTRPGAGRIGKHIAEECMEQLNKTPLGSADSSDIIPSSIQPRQGTSKATATATSSSFSNPTASGSGSSSANRRDSSRQVATSHNGINVRLSSQADSNEGTSLLEHVMQEQTMDSLQNPGNDSNDEAALAFLMSLLEADAGLGGPVDFNDLPWPL